MEFSSQALKHSSDGKGRRVQTLRRHRDAVVNYAERQGLIIPLRENTWGVASKSQDDVLYTVYIGQLCNCDEKAESHLNEIARRCFQKGLVDALRELRLAVEQVVEHVSSTTGIEFEGPVRRTTVQGPGPTPKPKTILAYKSKRQVIADKKKEKPAPSHDGSDLDKVWDMDRDSLIICFLCGRREPPVAHEDPITWFGCSNQECKAWAHTCCTEGRFRVCSVCNIGVWQLDCGEGS
ncbi:hypothetical protein COOONC_24798 [Cooperia oncophora]